MSERMSELIFGWLRVALVASAVVAFVLAAAVFAKMLTEPSGSAQASPTPVPTPSPTPGETMMMGLAHIPTSSSCLLCHEEGGQAGLKPIPAMGHALEGWTACAVCHTDDTLGRLAPGHSGISEGECLSCHRVARDGPAITQPHARLQDQHHCLDCHGSVAHLPSSMVGRNQDECWLCHKPDPSPPPLKPHPTVENVTCRNCHRAADIGALPFDHALREDATCTLCHDVPGASPAVVPSLIP